MNISILTTLLQMRTDRLFPVLRKILEERYPKVYAKEGKYIYAPGEIPLGLVAHIDTVHSFPSEEFFYDQEKKVLWAADGLGADDRAGIYAILTLIEKGYRPTIIFTDKEETGGQGAKELITDFPKCRKNLNFLIEIDRQGQNDCVFYQCDNQKFNTFIESFGFKTAYGTFTDISVICPQWGIAGVNVSAGYVDEHSFSERLYTEWLDSTIDKIKNILDSKTKKYKYIQDKFRTSYYFTDSKCKYCGNSVIGTDYLDCYDKNVIPRKVCWDCLIDKKINSNINWCDTCGIAFFGEECPACSTQV